MSAREKHFVLAGLLMGLLVAGLIYVPGGWRRARPGFAASREAKTAGQQAAPRPGSGAHGGQHAAHPMTTGEQAPVAETLPVQLSEEEQQAIGLETEEVRRQSIARPVLAVGKVEEAETRLSTISARVGGRIDRLLLDFTGQPVARGQAVASLYSPELVTGAEEYKLARENRARLAGALPEAVAQADELVASARRKLELWGVTSKQLQEIESSAEPKIHVTIYSPTSGIVTERKVTEGQYVREGDVLYTVADLSTVWVKADVYEPDLPLVRLGQAAEITSEALPGTKLRGRVSFLEPMLNQQTRTVAARIEVPNPGMRLRPGMFVNARLLTSAEKVLAVPRSAVLDTGMRKVVYVAKGGGLFEGRPVEVGPPGDEYYPVLSGLKEGDRVVTRGNFMIDSQTRITGGMTGLFGGSKEFAREGQPAPQYKITFRPEPDPPKGTAQNTFRVTVVDAGGAPVTDAQVRILLLMPAMPAMGMPEMHASAELAWKGAEYSGMTILPMAGPWVATVEVSRGGQVLATYHASFTAR